MNSIIDLTRISYNKRQMSRIYPKGGRVDSSNYMPQVGKSGFVLLDVGLLNVYFFKITDETYVLVAVNLLLILHRLHPGKPSRYITSTTSTQPSHPFVSSSE